MCGEEVLWLRTEYGNNVPVEPQPVVLLQETAIGELGGRFFVTRWGTSSQRYRVTRVDADDVIYRLHNPECFEKHYQRKEAAVP